MVAALAGLFASSCSRIENPSEVQENYVNVSLACAGEILDVSTSPLSKPGDYHQTNLYFVQVYSLGEGEMKDGDVYYPQTPYAYGYFEESLEGVTVKLLEGKDYGFNVSIVINQDLYGNPYTREFNYTTTTYPFTMPVEKEGYYGELKKFTATQDGSVVVQTKRVSYGAKFIAEDLTEGSLSIKVLAEGNWSIYTATLTSENPTLEKIYTFSSPYQAWQGRWKEGAYVNYYSTKKLDISWTKANGENVPIGVYEVTFERNVKTTIRIKVEELSKSSGISVEMEETPFVEDTDVYYIQGGTVTEVPMS